MQVVSFPARQARSHYRHDLRTLTYVTLDTANGGIIRNLNRQGAAVQAVAALRLHQRVRVRFELRFPRFRVETYGRVNWSNASGQCGIEFEELPAKVARQIDEWIFSNLLETMARHAGSANSIFGASSGPVGPQDGEDGMLVSGAPRPAIQPGLPIATTRSVDDLELNWLSRPLSPRTLAGMIDGLVVVAGLLLFALIFLSIAHELPPWPLSLGAVLSAAVLVALAYWGLFAWLGGTSVGVRLARDASASGDEK